jgi:hypothetical protein
VAVRRLILMARIAAARADIEKRRFTGRAGGLSGNTSRSPQDRWQDGWVEEISQEDQKLRILLRRAPSRADDVCARKSLRDFLAGSRKRER